MSLDSLLKGLDSPAWKGWQEVPSATTCSKQQQEGQTMWLGAFSSPILKSSKNTDRAASLSNLLHSALSTQGKSFPFIYNIGFSCFNLDPQFLIVYLEKDPFNNKEDQAATDQGLRQFWLDLILTTSSGTEPKLIKLPQRNWKDLLSYLRTWSVNLSKVLLGAEGHDNTQKPNQPPICEYSFKI